MIRLTLALLLSFLLSGIQAADRPNILWIYVDDMSDWMGCYGDKTVPTPNIDSLATKGVLFERAYMPAPVCSATRSALITGCMQTSHGLHHHRTMLKDPLAKDIITVPELFRAAGYTTFNESKEDYNFTRDRDLLFSPEFVRPKGVRGHIEASHLSCLAQLKGGKPFFGQLQLKGGKIGGESGSKPMPSRIKPEDVTVPPCYPDTPVMRAAIARHYEQVAITDKLVGDILAELDKLELRENTAIFLFTDHGCPLPRAKQFLYEDGTKVPLIVHWPKGQAQLAAKGTRRTDLVNGIDIAGTSLALAGIDRPDYMEAQDIFAADFKGREFAVSARDRCGIAVDRIRAIGTERFRYIRNFQTDRAMWQSNYRDKFSTFVELNRVKDAGGLSPLQLSYMTADQRPTEELYDLESDPDQTKNLVKDPAHAATLKAHRKMLDDWMEKSGDQGDRPESKARLKAVFEVAKGKAPAPEFDFLR